MFRRAEIPAAVVLLGVAAYLAHARVGSSAAADLRPLYESGRALRTGQPIYSVPRFVYPPFAAIAAVPLSLLSYHSAGYLYSIVQVVVPAVAMALAGAAVFPRHRLLAGAGVAVLLLKSDVFVNSLYLNNPSLLFVLPLAAAALLWASRRWTAGSVVLAVSVAVKPLLVALWLLPISRRHTRAGLVGVSVAAALTAIGAAFSHDLHGLLRLPGQVLNGTDLHGAGQVDNVSLASIGIVHPAARWPLYLVRAAAAVGTVITLWRLRASRLDAPRALIVTGALALVIAVCGSLDEIHYGILALPACVALVAGGGGRVAQALGVVGTLVLCTPLYNLHIATTTREDQLRWGLGQAVVLLACIVAMAQMTTSTSTLPRHALDTTREPAPQP